MYYPPQLIPGHPQLSRLAAVACWAFPTAWFRLVLSSNIHAMEAAETTTFATESVLLWHVATDLCFYYDGGSDGDAKLAEYIGISRAVSNYMLFLLIARLFMLAAGIGQIRFGDTCAEAKIFFEREMARSDERAVVAMVLVVNAEVAPRDVKGDRSKSVLFDACRLAKSLLELQSGKRWRLIRVVCVEILCYAASKCQSNFHAKQPSNGGELLTVVWFLMAHLGMGEQYRI
ncbi:hypothetical protein E2562_009267 [Oryza meyeriana var. granulata]|uniref:DUF4220 domain-containing protein n=1 Tax=Oryza meyeriana var. granulata TaxID=110450 RepID=A0A6G1EAB4_9ORYZ|nr:hypothetical protein E2562_009267 [Oryza meyeriana var. granulata]